jgi:hypothetical protein
MARSSQPARPGTRREGLTGTTRGIHRRTSDRTAHTRPPATDRWRSAGACRRRPLLWRARSAGVPPTPAPFLRCGHGAWGLHLRSYGLQRACAPSDNEGGACARPTVCHRREGQAQAGDTRRAASRSRPQRLGSKFRPADRGGVASQPATAGFARTDRGSNSGRRAEGLLTEPLGPMRADGLSRSRNL